MPVPLLRVPVILALLALLVVGCVGGPPGEVVLDGLTNPRNIAFDADGALLVAEAGTGVDDGRITRRATDGRRTTVLDRLPSFTYTPTEIVGPAAMHVLGGDLYWIQGLGRDERWSGGLLRLREGRVEVLASPRFAARSAPDGDTTIANPFDLLLEPDGTAYVSDASANVVWRIDPERRVRAHVYWTAIENPVPTGLARAPDGGYYVALFSQEPHVPGSGKIARFDDEGNHAVAFEGLTAPIALEVAPDGALLVLEFAGGFRSGRPIGFAPCSGRLLRLADGNREVLYEGLRYPTDLVLAPDGGYYVTEMGAFGSDDGRVVRLPPPDQHPFPSFSLSSRSGRCRG